MSRRHEMNVKEIAVTGTLAEDIAYYADQAGMQPEEYIEYATTRIMMPLTIMDLLDILPDSQRVYLLKDSDMEPYRISAGDVPDGWMETPIKEIRSGGDRTLLIGLEDEDAQEDS